ncbi:MAG: hypothetical protein AABW41_02040 [Nanoarchaeota archaeon]
MHPDADKVKIADDLKIKWSGVFDVGDFYNRLKQWFVQEGYGDELKNFKEIKFVQRVKQTGKEIEIKWIGEKNVSDYFAYAITITVAASQIKDVEIQRDGKKLKMNSGSLDIRLFADFVKNAKGRWKKESFMKKVYERFVVKERMDSYKLGLYQKVYGLQDYIKEYLGISKF